MTRADAIRTMSDEALADQLVREQIVSAYTLLEYIDEEKAEEFSKHISDNWKEILQEKLEWLKENYT